MSDSATIQFQQAIPVFLVSDIAATMQWYKIRLGFDARMTPEAPPYAFCILSAEPDQS